MAGARVGIIGTGWVGASVAISTLHSGLVRELPLHDARAEVAQGEAMDLSHGAPCSVGARGAARVLAPAMDEHEKVQLARSADILRSAIASI